MNKMTITERYLSKSPKVTIMASHRLLEINE